MFGMSLPELLLVVVLALVVFGPERIPKVARTVGRVLREARRAANEVRNTLDIEDVRRDLRTRNLARQRTETPPPGTAPTAPLVTPPPPQAAAAPVLAAAPPHAGPPDPENPHRAAVPAVPADAAALPTLRRPAGTVALDEDTADGHDDAAAAAEAAREAELAREDARLARDLRAYLGLAEAAAALHVVALPPRSVPAGRLEHCALRLAAVQATAALHRVTLPARTA